MNLDKDKRILKNKRVWIGPKRKDCTDLPPLIEIQLKSFEDFLQRERLISGLELENKGLHKLFKEVFPIKSNDEKMSLEYEKYLLEEDNIKYDEFTAKIKGQHYSIPLKILINLRIEETGEIRQKDIYLGEIPLMTDRGTFIINGAERVVVSQIHRSPGVIFNYDNKTGVYNSRIIPYKGSWLEFEIEEKKKLVYVKTNSTQEESN